MIPNPDRHQLAALGEYLQLERWREDFRRWAEGMDWREAPRQMPLPTTTRTAKRP